MVALSRRRGCPEIENWGGGGISEFRDKNIDKFRIIPRRINMYEAADAPCCKGRRFLRAEFRARRFD